MSGVPNPPWLTADQQRIWRTYLAGKARIETYLNAVLGQFGLDLNEYEILVRLSEADDHSLRMSELAGQAFQSRSRLTHTAQRMEDKGLLHRKRADDDRRGVMARLTDKGMALLVEITPLHMKSIRAALVDIATPDDLDALGRIMTSVLAASLEQ